MKRFVFLFEETRKGNTEQAQFILGNKGAQLSEMVAIGLPVPPGFTISTEACRAYYSNNKKWPSGLETQVLQKLSSLEKKTGKKLGFPKNPLLVSVRSGSYVSMPGMMDTILNLGLNDDTVKGFAEKTNERTAWDSYRRFIQMFSDVVLGVKHEEFEKILSREKNEKKLKNDTELSASDLQKIVSEYKKLVNEKTRNPFPQDTKKQLLLAITAVFDSWNNPRAIAYRKINRLRSDAGTGVTVQSMVFGNMGDDSGTGVAFTRNPATGKKEHYGEFLLNAQGEDVVAGIRTPQPISSLKKKIPSAFSRLLKLFKLLEKHYREMQDFEFTIENKKLFLLQTRSGKRTAMAAVKIAVDMAKESLITKKEAVLQVKPEQLNQLMHKQFSQESKKHGKVIAKGLAASPGAAIGKAVFSAEKAAHLVSVDADAKIILVRPETSPEDIEGMHAAQGILTSTGGLTSHAAVVARGMGKCCIAGCGDIKVNEEQGYFTAAQNGDETRVMEGEWVSIDGGTGEVFLGELELVEASLSGEFALLLKWADSFRKLGVRANADTPKDAAVARGFGAEGIGLCRTEHMFFEESRIKAFREMILADSEQARRKALAKLLPYQKQDFLEIFKIMSGLPVKIRFLDPPLHEFLPKDQKAIESLAKEMNVSVEKLERLNASLHEFNPMLGFRGCRLGIVYPEITEMQARAIFEAACESAKEGKKVVPEIMIPDLISAEEMKQLRNLVEGIAAEEMKKHNIKIKYEIGCMIEFPRAAITADEIAQYSDFFSFGTNDLTQTTLAFSRDDAGKFSPSYIEKGIFERDPFEVLDRQGVGVLMQIAVEKARKAKKHFNIGICGEHGGNPESIEFSHMIGLDYVSCSPYRVPIARLAAAQAALNHPMKK